MDGGFTSEEEQWGKVDRAGGHLGASLRVAPTPQQWTSRGRTWSCGEASFLGAGGGQGRRFEEVLLARWRTQALSLCSKNKRTLRNRTTRRERAEGKQ